MKPLLTLLSICAAVLLYGQGAFYSTSPLMTNSYRVDSIINDSVTFTTFYHRNYTGYNDTSYIFNGPAQMDERGTFVRVGNLETKIGYWETWHYNGKKELEMYFNAPNGGEHYVNMWLRDGTQILKNGNGYVHLPRSDSTIYEIRDSVRHGLQRNYQRYRLDEPYSLESIRLFYKGELQPFDIRFWLSGKMHSMNNGMSKANEEMGCSFYYNGMIEELAASNNHRGNGPWMFWNENGILIKEGTYVEGGLKGVYKEYHDNGQISMIGNYVHITGKDTIRVIDPVTLEEQVTVTVNKNHPVKDGEWKYYNDKGELVKREYYEKGVLRKN